MQLTLPPDHRHHLAERLGAFMSHFGYERLETPIIDSADLFLTRAGDQIIDHLFTFERLGHQWALRPEFTAAAAHAYAERFPDHQPVVRWQFRGSVFEDNPNADSYQRYSIGAELIGMAGDAADAEIIAMAAGGIDHLGSSGWTLVLGHVQLMRLLLSRFNLDSRTGRFLLNHLASLRDPAEGKAHVLALLDRLLGRGDLPEVATDYAVGDSAAELNTQQILDVLLDATQHGATMGGRTRHDIVRRLLQKRQRANERDQIVAAIDFLERWTAIDDMPETAFRQIEMMIATDDVAAHGVVTSWRRVIALLDAYGIPADSIRVQPALARNWDYYTGIVFEINSADGLHLGGGGRYDELTRLIGGKRDVPAVGFAYYADALAKAVPLLKSAPRQALTIAVTPETDAVAVHWAQALRGRGVPVVLMPDAAASPTLIPLTDGSARLGAQTYRLEHIDALIASLEMTE